MDPDVEAAPAKAGRRQWLGLAVLALPTLLLSLDLSVLYLALPHLSSDLGASSVQQLWITDIYGFMVAGFLVTMGTIGDRIGRRTLLMVGGAAFGIASIIAAFSSSPEMLIAARVALGIAGASLGPSALALVSTMFTDQKQQAIAISVIVTCFMGGSAIGPLVGGVLLEFFWWGSVFLLGVPVMALLLLAGPALLPEGKNPSPGKLDLTSVALSLAAILPLIYGLKEIAKHGWTFVPTLAAALGVACALAFVVRQRKLTTPLLDLRLFGNRTFSSALSILLVGGIFLGGTTLLVTQYLQLVADLSPLAAGLWLLPAIIAMTIGSMIAPKLAATIRPGYVMATGMAIAAVGFAVVTQVDASSNLGLLVVGWVIALFGNGLPAGLGVALVLGSAPPENAGAASSLSETSTEFGMALGLALVGTVGTVVYSNRMSDAIPEGTPAELAGPAQDNINGALALADRLPEIVAPARDAFATGLSVSATAGAIAFALLAVAAAMTLRHVPAFGDGAAEAPAEDADDSTASEAETPADQPEPATSNVTA